ncbi:hypothetical protein FACS189413_14070 [Bacteroidia bacterium]|nr:hypothetical protein FACS189413_14070 [Bacteroidia bacterium]
MKKQLCVYLCLVLAIVSIQGQNSEQKTRTVRRTTIEQKTAITIIEQNEDFAVSEKQQEFYFIEEAFPQDNNRWLATLEGYCTNTKKSNLENLFYDFWKTANELGANSFYIDDFYNTPDSISVTISVFNLTEKELDENYALYPCNNLYVFGDLITSPSNKGRNFTVNKEKITVYPLSYYLYRSDEGEKVNISIGGVFGSGYTRKAEANKPSIYLSLGGLKVRPGITPGGAGLSFSTGSIFPLDMNFGQFLVEILKDE